MKLTDGRSGNIAKAKPPAKGQRLIFDEHRDAPRGFALRITAAGTKAFILRYMVDGRERRKTIGQWPAWGAEAAREEARKLLVRIDQGHDPLEEKRRRRNEPTVAELAEEWLNKHAAGLSSEQSLRSYVANVLLPAIGRLKVTDVRRIDVIQLVEAKADKAPRAAAQVLGIARQIFDYAANRDLIPANPVAGLKPKDISVPGRRNALAPKARTRVLDHDEIRAFWLNADSAGLHRLTALCLKMVLVTGQRPGEVAGMRESEINGRTWTIPAARRGKTESEHTVYLTDTALELLAAAADERARLARRRDDTASDHVFQTRPGSSVTSAALARAVDRAHGRLGAKSDGPLGRWSPHDLRRTMRTGLSASRIRPDIAEMTIGHVKRGIIAVYDQHAFESDRRAALEAWEARLTQIVSGQDPDAACENVVRLEGTGR